MIGAFEQARHIRGEEAGSSAMIERRRQQLENPAKEDWDGTTIARSKQGPNAGGLRAAAAWP